MPTSAWGTQCPSTTSGTNIPSPGSVTVESLAPGFVLPISKGGTGATTAAKARLNLGIVLSPGTDSTQLYTVAATLSGHTVVASTEAGLVPASPGNMAHANSAIGITKASASSGDIISIMSLGEFTESTWTWTPSLPIFLGSAGQLTQTVPSFPDLFSLKVGVALSATKMLVSFYPAIFIDQEI